MGYFKFSFKGQLTQPRRKLGVFLISLPLLLLSADVLSMFLVGEMSALFMQQYYQGLFSKTDFMRPFHGNIYFIALGVHCLSYTKFYFHY